MRFKLCFTILLILTPSAGLAQFPSGSQRAKPTVLPHIDPNARFRSLDQKPIINMVDYQGRVVVLALWASWCFPCQQTVIALEAVHQDFAGRGVEVIALSVEDPQRDQKDVRRFLAQTNITYQLGWISKISADKLQAGQGVLPQVFVIKDGVIIKRFQGWHPTNTMPLLRETVARALDQKRATPEATPPETSSRGRSRRDK